MLFIFADVDECFEDDTVCGPNSNCTNSLGSYLCTCTSGYGLNEPDIMGSVANPCKGLCWCSESLSHLLTFALYSWMKWPMCALSSTDIDECKETPGICGKATVCTNSLGTFYCSCPDGFFPSTGTEWTVGISFCESEKSFKIKMYENVDVDVDICCMWFFLLSL